MTIQPLPPAPHLTFSTNIDMIPAMQPQTTRTTNLKHLNRLLLICLLYIACPKQGHAQTGEIELRVGDSLTLGTCSNPTFGFMAIDMVTKTRWVDRGITYDTATGEGFYPYFFNEGDVDSKRLPCDYTGKKFRIAGLQQIKQDSGLYKTIIFGQLSTNPMEILWVEVEQAAKLKELVF